MGASTRRGRWLAALMAAGIVAAAVVAQTGEPSPVSAVAAGSGLEATIVRTANGVPHITGATLADVTFGQGWASGEDRPCDLLDQVLRVNGERARWLGRGDGEVHLRSDLGWRALGVRAASDRDLPRASALVRESMASFAAGWNAQLRAVGSEGLRGWCAGEPWVREVEPVEVYALTRAVALLASGTQVVDYVATAVPPGGSTPPPPPTTPTPSPSTDPTSPVPSDPGAPPAAPPASPVAGQASFTGSNGWAIGSERSASGGGLLLANPHLPWDGEYRFSEVHLTVPGQLNVYGAQLAGLPGLAMGFTDTFGWAHTTASGNRFTGYRLDLVPGDPTAYRYGDEVRRMTPVDITIDVRAPDGSVRSETHRRWRSHHGPILSIPELPWSDQLALTYRDANIDNDEFAEQYSAMVLAGSLDEMIEIDRTYQGQTMFNTIAASADGRAWFADTAATPNLSEAALEQLERDIVEDPLVALAYGRRLVLLDGSDPLYEWEQEPGARDPGLVPWEQMPTRLERDHVFNSNDSFWLSNARRPLEGDYSLLHGVQRRELSSRSRLNARSIDDSSPGGLAGADGRWDLDELTEVALDDRSFTAGELRAEVVDRCLLAPPTPVAAVLAPDGTELLPAAVVDLTEACTVLGSWDGRSDLDSAGAPLWRELGAQGGIRWAVPFDPADPVGTPRGLAPAPATGEDPLAASLARAVQVLRAARHGPDVALRSLQATVRDGQRIPLHGDGQDGSMNIVGWGSATPVTSLDPAARRTQAAPFAQGGSLSRVSGDVDFVGYPVNYGNSFMLAVAWGPGGPEARSILAYGGTSDEGDPRYVEATERFAAKQWTPVAFTAEEVAAAAVSSTAVGG